MKNLAPFSLINTITNKTQNYCNCIFKKINIFISFCNSHNATLLYLSAFFYKIVIDLIYINAIGPRFSYIGMPLEANGIKYVFSWFLFLCIIVLLPKIENSISAFFLHFQVMLTITPLLSFYALANQNTLYILLIFGVIILQIIFLKPSNKSCISIRLSNLSSITILFTISFITVSFFIALIWNGFYGLAAFNFEYLYRIREVANYPTILNYIFTWCHSILIPFFMLYFMSKKNVIGFFYLFLMQLGFFMILGHKIIWLRFFILIVVYIISNLKMPIKFMYMGLTFGLLCILIMFLLNHNNSDIPLYSMDLICQRGIFYPSKLKFVYYEFFNEYPKLLFSEGQIGKIFNLQYPFAFPVGKVISPYFKGKGFAAENAVTGYLAESYSQMGFAGMIIISLMLVFMIRFIDKNRNEQSNMIFLPCIASLVVTINDSSFLTSLLNGGYFILILFSMIFNQDVKKEQVYRGSL